MGKAWLQLAAICQHFDPAGNSLIGIVGEFEIAGELPQAGKIGEMAFIVNGSPGRHELRWTIISPSGSASAQIDPLVVTIEGVQAKGHGPVQMEIAEHGLYWVEVYLDDELATRFPVKISPLISTETEAVHRA